jgi:hypothetical protein
VADRSDDEPVKANLQVQQILTTINKVAEMSTCCSFTPMQTPIGDHIIVDSAITCPQCSTAKTERMPVDACQIVYKMYRLWVHIAAEVRGLLRVLFMRFCSVPADSGLNLVGCSTESAAGFAPFSILSVWVTARRK